MSPTAFTGLLPGYNFNTLGYLNNSRKIDYIQQSQLEAIRSLPAASVLLWAQGTQPITSPAPDWATNVTPALNPVATPALNTATGFDDPVTYEPANPAPQTTPQALPIGGLALPFIQPVVQTAAPATPYAAPVTTTSTPYNEPHLKSTIGFAFSSPFGQLNSVQQFGNVYYESENKLMMKHLCDDSNSVGCLGETDTMYPVIGNNFIQFYNSMKAHSASLPSLQFDKSSPINSKVINLGSKVGNLVMSVYRISMDDDSDSGFVTAYSTF